MTGIGGSLSRAIMIASQHLPSRFQPAAEFFAEVITPRQLSKKLLADNRS
jgi:hypothetical protein